MTDRKMTVDEAAKYWANKRAGERKAIIAYSDIHDAFKAGYEQGTQDECDKWTGVEEVLEWMARCGHPAIVPKAQEALITLRGRK